MKLQYSIRSCLFATAFVATACGWYVSNEAQRRHETMLLEDLRQVTLHGVVVADGAHPYGGCGTWEGAMAHLDFRGPAVLRPLKLDAFKRVVRVDVKCEANVEIIAKLKNFRFLERVILDNRSFNSGEEPPPEERQYVEAIHQFRSSNPTIDVHFFADYEPHLTSANEDRISEHEN